MTGYEGKQRMNITMEVTKMFKVAFTDHRIQNLRDPVTVRAKIARFLSLQHEEHSDLMVISGGALGVDQLAAEEAQRQAIPVIFILPFPVSVISARWRSKDWEHLKALVTKATAAYQIQKGFSFDAYQLRNEAMANHCDLLCAVFSGLPGGTANCIRYAEEQGTNIHMTSP